MFFRTLATFSALANSASAADPLIDALSGNPIFASSTDNAAFSMNAQVEIVNAPRANGDEGMADFTIDVGVNMVLNGNPHHFQAQALCENEVFLFEDGALLFAPYSDDSEIGACTRGFIDQLNAGFGATAVVSPISLAIADSGNSLIFNFIGAQIPLARL